MCRLFIKACLSCGRSHGRTWSIPCSKVSKNLGTKTLFCEGRMITSLTTEKVVSTCSYCLRDEGRLFGALASVKEVGDATAPARKVPERFKGFSRKPVQPTSRTLQSIKEYGAQMQKYHLCQLSSGGTNIPACLLDWLKYGPLSATRFQPPPVSLKRKHVCDHNSESMWSIHLPNPRPEEDADNLTPSGRPVLPGPPLCLRAWPKDRPVWFNRQHPIPKVRTGGMCITSPQQSIRLVNRDVTEVAGSKRKLQESDSTDTLPSPITKRASGMCINSSQQPSQPVGQDVTQGGSSRRILRVSESTETVQITPSKRRRLRSPSPQQRDAQYQAPSQHLLHPAAENLRTSLAERKARVQPLQIETPSPHPLNSAASNTRMSLAERTRHHQAPQNETSSQHLPDSAASNSRTSLTERTGRLQSPQNAQASTTSRPGHPSRRHIPIRREYARALDSPTRRCAVALAATETKANQPAQNSFLMMPTRTRQLSPALPTYSSQELGMNDIDRAAILTSYMDTRPSSPEPAMTEQEVFALLDMEMPSPPKPKDLPFEG